MKVRMKILFWQWNAFLQRGMERALDDLNVEYEVFFYHLTDWEKDNTFEALFRHRLNEQKYDIVLSVNYCPLVSNICQESDIRYVSWVYDAPIHIRDISSFHNVCNRIYFFDRGQTEKYLKAGYSNIFHLPLAADTRVWQFEKDKKYECDVAFVGQLYQSFYDCLMSPLPQYYRGMTEGFINAQSEVYGAYFLDELITDDFMEDVNEFYVHAFADGKGLEKRQMEWACVCELTRRERIMALSLLAGRYHVHLYSKDNELQNGGIYCGPVEYYSEMPSAFRGAKINLNISLKAIRFGIPLRVLDIMSCGGFLITNFQQELLEYFEPDEDLVIYENMKDLVDKVEYYLINEEERKRIAQNGYGKIKKYFGFEERMKHLLG